MPTVEPQAPNDPQQPQTTPPTETKTEEEAKKKEERKKRDKKILHGGSIVAAPIPIVSPACGRCREGVISVQSYLLKGNATNLNMGLNMGQLIKESLHSDRPDENNSKALTSHRRQRAKQFRNLPCDRHS